MFYITPIPTTTSHFPRRVDLLVHVVCEPVLQHLCEGSLLFWMDVNTHDLTHLAGETIIQRYSYQPDNTTLLHSSNLNVHTHDLTHLAGETIIQRYSYQPDNTTLLHSSNLNVHTHDLTHLAGETIIQRYSYQTDNIILHSSSTATYVRHSNEILQTSMHEPFNDCRLGVLKLRLRHKLDITYLMLGAMQWFRNYLCSKCVQMSVL